MPNWCSVRIAIIADKEKKGAKESLTELHKLLTSTPQIAREHASADWLGNYLAAAGINPDHLGARSFVYETDEELTEDSEKLWFCVSTEDAWSPKVAAWDALLEGKPLRYVFRAEEPGVCIYVNTDNTGDIFPERYRMDYCIPRDNGSEDNDLLYFDDEQELLEAFKEICGIEAESYEQARQEAAKMVGQSLAEGKDCWLSIDKYDRLNG